MSIMKKVTGIDTGNYILQFNNIKSIRHENELLEIKIKEFKPIGFFNLLKRLH